MTATETLAELRSLGVVLEPAEDKLKYRAPKGVLTPELRQAMTEYKVEILALLTAPPDTEALLTRLRNGQSWLLDQHQRWQSGDSTAADDAAFSKAWNGWWELDWQLRAEYGLAGCIHGSSGTCPNGFGCMGCVEVPAPSVVAQLELVEITEKAAP